MAKGGHLFAPNLFPKLFDKVVEVLKLKKEKAAEAGASDKTWVLSDF